MTGPFDYPSAPHVRRHGPQGYADYESYRDWLRDEFSFRCVYCLTREVWIVGGFHLDHFVPTSRDDSLATDYRNLLYACSACNQIKQNLAIPDPTAELLAGSIELLPDGSLLARTDGAKRLVGALRLNRPLLCGYRRMWISVVTMAREANPDLWKQILGFPADLPDLSKLRPPDGNDKPGGVGQSYFRLRQKGELPETY